MRDDRILLDILRRNVRKEDSCNWCAYFDDKEIDDEDVDSLKSLSRDVIRNHLLELDRHANLFTRIPQLGLKSEPSQYLLYNVSLDEDFKSETNETQLK